MKHLKGKKTNECGLTRLSQAVGVITSVIDTHL